MSGNGRFCCRFRRLCCQKRHLCIRKQATLYPETGNKQATLLPETATKCRFWQQSCLFQDEKLPFSATSKLLQCSTLVCAILVYCIQSHTELITSQSQRSINTFRLKCSISYFESALSVAPSDSVFSRSAIGITLSSVRLSVRLSVCNAIHCGSQGRRTGPSVFIARKFLCPFRHLL